MTEKRDIKGDIFGGITAGIVALPLALAFGVTSGLGAIAGLYGAIAVGFFAALFGGTRTQISGPTGPMTVVAATVIAAFAKDPGVIFTIFMLAGLIQIALGLAKVGKFIEYMPYPVVSGFMSGIGVIIILLQINPFLGLPASAKVTEAISGIFTSLTNAHLPAVILASATVAIIYLFPRITKAVPSTLVALIVCTLAAYLLKIDVAKIGEIPSGLPQLQLPAFDLTLLSAILVPAITLALLGAIDSLLTSLVADNLTKTKHNSNKELIGQGIGNTFAGLIGGIPGAGATMRTLVNIKSGGNSNISGMTHALFLVAVVLGLGFLAAEIPLSVLAGILVTVGIGIIDYKGIKDMRVVPKADSAVMLVVLGLTVFVDLLQAVAVGLIMSSLIFMKKMGDLATQNSQVKTLENFSDDQAFKLMKNTGSISLLGDKLMVMDIDGPLFFGFASSFKQMGNGYKDLKVVVFNLEKVNFIDQTGLYAFEDVIRLLNEKGIEIIICGIHGNILEAFKKSAIVPQLIPDKNIFYTEEESIAFAYDLLKEEKLMA